MVLARSLRRPALALLAALALTTAACSASGGGSDASPTTEANGTTTTTSDGPSTTRGGGGGTTTTDPDEPDPQPASAPEVGDCWTPVFGEDLEAVSFAGEQADCADEHGGETVAVVELTDANAEDITPELLDGDPSDPDVAGPIQSLGSTECGPAWDEILAPLVLDPGDGILNSAARATKLHRTFWLPTGDQWEDGARWLRCDLQTDDGTTFTTPVDEVQPTKVPADLVPCLAKSIGTGKGTECRSPEATWQVMASFSIKNAAGPEDTVAYRELLEKTLPPVCRDLTTQIAGDVGDRVFRIFTQSGFEESTGDFACAVRVTGPVTEPFGS